MSETPTPRKPQPVCAGCGQPYRPLTEAGLRRAYRGLATDQIRQLLALCADCRRTVAASQLNRTRRK